MRICILKSASIQKCQNFVFPFFPPSLFYIINLNYWYWLYPISLVRIINLTNWAHISGGSSQGYDLFWSSLLTTSGWRRDRTNFPSLTLPYESIHRHTLGMLWSRAYFLIDFLQWAKAMLPPKSLREIACMPSAMQGEKVETNKRWRHEMNEY